MKVIQLHQSASISLKSSKPSIQTNYLSMGDASQTIYLVPMAHLVEAKGAEDDWAGISDWSARKQLQNRLNQRAYS
jgi:hypothetical protein